jgi:4-hydroxybenzoate polyprenyltransferase
VNKIIGFTNGFLKLIRINNLIILYFTQYFTAIFLIDPDNRSLRLSEDYHLFLLAFSTMLIAAAGYIINDYHDVKIDAINKPEKILVGKVLKRREMLLVYGILNLIAFAIAFQISYQILAVHLLSASSLWIYSAFLKKTAFWGNFLIASLTALSILIVAVYYNNNYLYIGLYGTLAFFISLIREIVKDLEDMKGDAAFGGRTIPIIYGQRGAKQFIYVFATFFIISLYVFDIFIDIWSFWIISIVITGEILVLLYFVYWADTKDKYHFCSNFCKAILLSGVLSMIWVN